MDLKEYMNLLVELEAAKALILVLEAENETLRQENMRSTPINHFELLRES